MNFNSAKGFSLMEFLVATTFFLILVVYGYQSLIHQHLLSKAILSWTASEKESNYRMLLLKHQIEQASHKLKSSSLLENVPLFLPNLDFSGTVTENAFSVAVPDGVTTSFQKKGNSYYEIAPAIPVEPERICIFGGMDENAKYCWNYGRIDSIQLTQTGVELRISFFFAGQPVIGTMAPVQMQRFLFEDNTLYQISASAQREPFFGPLDLFQFQWNPPKLIILWKKGKTECEFTTIL